jgi:hypothetical protein
MPSTSRSIAPSSLAGRTGMRPSKTVIGGIHASHTIAGSSAASIASPPSPSTEETERLSRSAASRVSASPPPVSVKSSSVAPSSVIGDTKKRCSTNFTGIGIGRPGVGTLGDACSVLPRGSGAVAVTWLVPLEVEQAASSSSVIAGRGGRMAWRR